MTNKTVECCPLCGNTSQLFYNDIFYKCTECFGIFRAKHLLISSIEEKKRYENHNNDVNDVAYQQFVSPITSAVCKDFTTNTIGLDFGAGTGSAISKVLTDFGYTIKQYDPFFHNVPDLLNKKYNYVVCCEVMEHFHHPKKEFNLLKNLLKPNGILYCMTHIYTNDIDFDNWYYKNDPTHVFIYQKETLEWIKNKFNFSSITINQRFIVFRNGNH